MTAKTRRNILLVIAGLTSIFFIPNIGTAIMYWWFEFTHAAFLFSPRYWILGTIFSGVLAGTVLLPPYIASTGSRWVNTASTTRAILIRSVAIVAAVILAPILLALIAGYIGPNFLQEFYQWMYG